MSSSKTSASFSFSSSSSSSATSNNGQTQTTGHRSVHQSHTSPDGTRTVQSTTQKIGEPAVRQTQTYDASGRELSGSGSGSSRRVQDVSDEEQAKRDAEYEERMEEEYAKREGGA